MRDLSRECLQAECKTDCENVPLPLKLPDQLHLVLLVAIARAVD
jgi:hypothetical protein